MARAFLCFVPLLIAACGASQASAPSPKLTQADYQKRLDEARARLQRLAEEQLKSRPDDDRLWLLAKALHDPKSPPDLAEADIPKTPLMAVLACSWGLHGGAGQRFEMPEVEDVEDGLDTLEKTLPGSSFEPLFRARWLVLQARTGAAFWAPLVAALEEALRRNRWDCPVRAFHGWAFEWLERHEPDAFVRASFNFRHVNLARSVLIDIMQIVEGGAYAPASPRPELPRLAHLLRRLAEDRALHGLDDIDFLLAQIVCQSVSQSEFLLAWRRGDKQAAKEALAAFEGALNREAAFEAYKPEYMKPFEALTWALTAVLERAFKPMLESTKKQDPKGDETPEKAIERMKEAAKDEDLALEASRRIESGAADYLAAQKASLNRRSAFCTVFAQQAPGGHRKRNFLGDAWNEWDLIAKDPLPAERLPVFLTIVFDPNSVSDMSTVGLDPLAWILRTALMRPASMPEGKLPFTGKPDLDLDVATVRRARGEAIPEGWKPDPVAARELAFPSNLYGYCVFLGDLAKKQPAQAVAWLLPPEGESPEGAETMVSETLRAATGQDFGPNWPRWKSFLESSK